MAKRLGSVVSKYRVPDGSRRIITTIINVEKNKKYRCRRNYETYFEFSAEVHDDHEMLGTADAVDLRKKARYRNSRQWIWKNEMLGTPQATVERDQGPLRRSRCA